MSKMPSNIFGVPIRVSNLVTDNQIAIIGAEKESQLTVPSERPGIHLGMKTREWQIIDFKKGKAFGGEITYATEILVTDKGLKMVTKYIDNQNFQLPRKGES